MKRYTAALFALLCVGCTTPRTEAVVVISTSGLRIGLDLDAIRLSVSDLAPQGPETKFSETLPLCEAGQVDSPTDRCFTLPVTANLIPGAAGASDSVRVKVEALVNRNPVIADAAVFTFADRQRLRIDFVLYANCVGN